MTARRLPEARWLVCTQVTLPQHCWRTKGKYRAEGLSSTLQSEWGTIECKACRHDLKLALLSRAHKVSLDSAGSVTVRAHPAW